jgi:hypothetical protein
VQPDEVRTFARRDWGAIAAAKNEAWLALRRARGIDGALAQADELRRQAREMRPDWPSEEERAEDLAAHNRVSEALRRAGRARRR